VAALGIRLDLCWGIAMLAVAAALPALARRAARRHALAVVVTLLIVASAARAASEPAGGPLLWSVERQGRRSHLFGTVHVALPLETTLGPAGIAALDHASRVYVELDLTDPGVAVEIRRLSAARAELPPGHSLRRLVRPETWRRMTALTRGRLPAGALDRLEPWFATLYVMPALVATPRERAEVRRWVGVPLDAEIAARAKARGLRVVPLETPLDQLQALIRPGRPAAVDMLEELVLRPESRREDVAGVIGAYTSNDERRVRKAFARMRRTNAALTEQLLFRRNERWVEHLDLWLGDGGVFVAAGAFHLFGERGLVELLRARGYRVERVRSPAAAG
jgi:uncharacterized protein YbaP (TraB family)